MGHQGAEDLSITEIGNGPDPDQDLDLPPGPGPDLHTPERRMTRDLVVMDMAIGGSDPATNLERESSLKVAAAPLTRSKSRINLNSVFIYLGSAVHHDHEVGLTIVDNFVVIGRFREFELTKPSNT